MDLSGLLFQGRAPVIAGNVLDNGITVTNSAAATTLLTVPAGRVWVGSLYLALSATAATAGLYKATIATAGTGVTPTAGTALLTTHMSLVGTTPAGLATFSNAAVDIVVVAPAGNSVTLTVTNSTATALTSDASAVGILL